MRVAGDRYKQTLAEELEAEFYRKKLEVRETPGLSFEAQERRIKALSDTLRERLRDLGVRETGAA